MRRWRLVDIMEVMQQLRAEVENNKEVLHHFKEEIEDAVEETLLLRRRSTVNGGDNTIATSAGEVAVDNSDTSNVNVEGDEKKGKSEDVVYFDKSEGDGLEWSHFNLKAEDLGAKLKDVDIQKVLSSVINGKEVNNLKDKLFPGSNLPTSTSPEVQEETEQRAEVDDGLEESDEEVVELEFERAVEKIHSHDDYNMYCPNCSSRITKVVLRRKIRQRRVPIQPETRRDDLFGCLSCFSIFVPSGNRLNPFRIFGADKGPESTPLLQQQQAPDASMPTSGTTQEKGGGFDLFGFFGKRRPQENGLHSPLLLPTDVNSSSPKITTTDQASDQEDGVKSIIPSAVPPAKSNGSVTNAADVGKIIQAPTPSQGSILNGNVIIDIVDKTEIYDKQPEIKIKGQNDTLSPINGGDVKIPVEETPVGPRIPQYTPTATDVLTNDARIPAMTTESQGSRSLEIVKSILYGGLMESITSLSVVSSAAASEATTLNIVALGLANLVGGLVVLAHNLRDLRYGDSSETNENRYKEQLGRRENFLLHATIAVLSYLVFGLIPPVIYGFTFRASDDRDFKLLAVAAASLLCIVILAIAKAYVRGENKFTAYFKTILYYVTSAVLVSGVAFAVGDLVNKLLERLGWFNPATVEPQLFPQAKSFNPTSWASY